MKKTLLTILAVTLSGCYAASPEERMVMMQTGLRMMEPPGYKMPAPMPTPTTRVVCTYVGNSTYCN